MSPLATSTGWVMPARQAGLLASGIPHVVIASIWASRASSVAGVSRSSVRVKMRWRKCQARGEAGLGALEEQRQDVLGPGLVAVRVDEHLVAEAVHVLATLWPGSGEHEAADEPRADQHDSCATYPPSE